MKARVINILFAILLVGCVDYETKHEISAESSNPIGGLSQWLRRCTNKLANNQPNEVRWFNGIGANDVEFMPVVNPAEEIFQKCESIEPLSADVASVYKKCLENCISEIQSITKDSTRGKVNRLLRQNGGLFSSRAAIYSHMMCEVIKVRIEFEPEPNEDGRSKLSENDKVKAVSMPYLGFFLVD